MKIKHNVKDSTSITSWEYNDLEKSMVVEFKAGSKYQYSGVEPEVVDQLILAESVGKHFAQNIKNKFPYRKIEAVTSDASWTIEEEEAFRQMDQNLNKK